MTSKANLPLFRRRAVRQTTRNARGFTLIEIVIVLAIGLVVMATAVPVIQSSLRYFALRSSVASLTGAIQSTRYQAIFNGCQFSVAFNAAAMSYQVTGSAPGAGGTVCAGALTAVGGVVPMPARSVSLNANATLLFRPGGLVVATTGATTMLLSNATTTATIQVSNYGNVSVTYAP